MILSVQQPSYPFQYQHPQERLLLRLSSLQCRYNRTVTIGDLNQTPLLLTFLSQLSLHFHGLQYQSSLVSILVSSKSTAPQTRNIPQPNTATLPQRPPVKRIAVLFVLSTATLPVSPAVNPKHECETSTVTDIFVSCQTGSCTTTKTSLASGCSVLATSTTTQAPWCPTGVPSEQEEDTDNLDNAPVVYGKEIFGLPQNGVIIVGSNRYPIYYAPNDPQGWYWWYPAAIKSFELPVSMFIPGTVISTVYPTSIVPQATVLIIPPIVGATRLAPTGSFLEKRYFDTNHDCGEFISDECQMRAHGPLDAACCLPNICGPVWQACNCRPDGECAGTDRTCCFDQGGINCAAQLGP